MTAVVVPDVPVAVMVQAPAVMPGLLVPPPQLLWQIRIH
jgi:hypothetical protein